MGNSCICVARVLGIAQAKFRTYTCELAICLRAGFKCINPLRPNGFNVCLRVLRDNKHNFIIDIYAQEQTRVENVFCCSEWILRW